MKKHLLTIVVSFIVATVSQAQSPTAPSSNPLTINFNKTRDLFIAQFDSKPDPDDIQAIAAVGCMLAHPDLHGVDFYAVQGTVGMQGYNAGTGENNNFIPAPTLMNLAFGQDRWSQAGFNNRNTFPQNSNYPNGSSFPNNFWGLNTNWTPAVNAVVNKAKTALDRGGMIYIMEAGNSDFTYDWVQSLVNTTSYTTTDTQTRIVVVQHSNWNENNTTTTPKRGISGNGTVPAGEATILEWVRNNTDYRRIEDGNGSNNSTPGYNSSNTTWQNQAEASSNPNTHARNLWLEADSVLAAHGFFPSYSNISVGGVDYSDASEAWYIFNVGTNADTIQKFWNRYVVNTDSASGPVPGPSGGGGTNALVCSSLPSTLENATTLNVSLDYEATGARDIYMEIRRVSDNAWITAQTVTVSAGVNTANFSFNFGTQSLGAYKFTAGMYNVGENWTNGTAYDNCSQIQFTVTAPGGGSDVGVTIPGPSFDAESHPSDANQIRVIGNVVGYVRAGNWIRYDSFNFDTGAGSVDVSASTDASSPGGRIEFRLGSTTGTLISTVNVTGTAGWNTYETFSANVTGATGVHDLYLVFVANTGSPFYLLNVQDFKFNAGGGSTTNALICSSLPSALSNATTLNVGLDYEATASRDIYLEIRRVSDNAWITAQTVTVSAGVNTANFALNFGTQNPGNYKFTSGMYNVGENWSNGTAYDNCSQIQFTVTAPGASASSSIGGTVVETPTQDVFIQNTTVFNDSNLKVEPSVRTSYLKFDVNGISGTVTGAKLIVQLTEAGNGTVRVYQGNSNPGWTEATINSGNAPGQGAQLGSDTGSYANGSTLEIDLGTSIGNGEITLVITMDGGGNDVWFSSSEGVNSPRLEVTYQ
ncbi:carbohydrate-binding protein [Rubellicoccus peritrichatus]|uniref:Carbohydrate-binding protein n=1 Tax=Rubellicoccus peritrichatus TaxID=3080537 RepID=A0AAQ3LD43_9BACT|nr:carbohydrate-binding protein [Puniceicoccus sp. CR14]WOO43182.1 carbohydrate-binding protein [Puniceicoccus sp. CR14]